MDHSQGPFQDVDEHGLHASSILRIGSVQTDLGHLQVPVAVRIPHEFVETTGGLVESIGLERRRNGFDRSMIEAHDPAVGWIFEVLGRRQTDLIVQVDLHEASRVPDLVAEVSAGLRDGRVLQTVVDNRRIEPDILSASALVEQRQTRCVPRRIDRSARAGRCRFRATCSSAFHRASARSDEPAPS